MENGDEYKKKENIVGGEDKPDWWGGVYVHSAILANGASISV